MDLKIVLFLNGLLNKNSGLDLVFYVLAVSLVFGLAILVLLYGLSMRDNKAMLKMISNVLASYLLARWIFTPLIQLFYHRQRPFYNNSLVEIFKHPETYSFPSGHAVGMFSVATIIFIRNKKWGALALMFSGLTAFARVAAGVHYPSDVIAGALIGLVAGLLIDKLSRFW